MEPWLAELIARGRRTGSLTFDEVNTAVPSSLTRDELAGIVEQLDAAGISLIDEPVDEVIAAPLPVLESEPTSDLDETDVLGGDYHRNAEFDRLLRANGVPFSDAACSLEPDGQVFDAELIVPGEHALTAWLALRNLVPITGLWPVIHGPVLGPDFQRHPDRLDPGGHIQEWHRRVRIERELPLPPFTPSVIRADAAANIARADAVPPTPWTFRAHRAHNWSPEPPDGQDTPLEPSEPDFAELFSNAGPFWAHRQGPSDDYPAHPFVQLRLYPTAVPWEVFAYVWSGGWNDAPYPEEQLSMLRYWHGLYGTELVSHRGDWYEMFVPRPPRTRHQALRLIEEMCRFGEETIFGYARHTTEDAVEQIRTAHHWYFWWD